MIDICFRRIAEKELIGGLFKSFEHSGCQPFCLSIGSTTDNACSLDPQRTITLLMFAIHIMNFIEIIVS